jgi:hypothetical protein
VSGILERGRSQPTILPGPVEGPAPAGDRGRKEPAVKELIWPKGHDLCKWEILPETNQLKVYTDSPALLKLGETDADSWEFSATLYQLNAVGHIGLFLGYQKNPQDSTVSYELLELVVVKNQVYLQRRQVKKHRADAPMYRDITTFGSVPIKNRESGNTLRLVVRKNELAEVYLNGDALRDLMILSTHSSAAGPFGVFNSNSDGVYSNLLFNGNPIPLFADATPRLEKP